MGTLRTFSELQKALGVALLIPQPGIGASDPVFANTAAASSALNVLKDTFVFQFFPESLSDTQSAIYDTTQIPGGSHPIYQWVAGGARTITFTAQFTSERLIPLPVADVLNIYNVDINGVMANLRYLLYPSYDRTSALKARPPKRLFLVIPGTLLGGFVPPVAVIMTDLTFEIQQWHAPGIPKLATASLTFNEIVQNANGGVRFVGRESFEIPKLLYNPLTTAARRAAN